MKYLFKFLLAVLVAGAFSARAQTLPEQWLLQDCLDYATNNNITLQSLQLSEDINLQNLQRAKAAKLPNLSGSINHSLVNSNNTDPVVGGFQTQASFTGNYGVSSAITLFNGNYLNNDVKEKSLYVRSAQLDIAESRNNIFTSIVQAYFNILLTAENIEYLKVVAATSSEQMQQGKQRYEAGSISKKEYLQFESQLASDNYNVINAQNNYRLNIFSLKQLLQLPSGYNLQIQEKNDKTLEQQSVLSLEAAQQSARASRPEIENKKLSIEIAQVGLEKVKAGRLPVISMNGGLSSGYSDNQLQAYFRQLNNNFYQQAGLSIAIPIFNRKVNTTNIAISKLQINQAKLDLQNTEIVLDQAVEQAYLNLKNAQDAYASTESLLKTSEAVLAITNEQLDLGAINMVELLQQKNTYVQALQSFLQAKYTMALYDRIYTFYATNQISSTN